MRFERQGKTPAEVIAMLRKLAAMRFPAADFRRMAQIAREERASGFRRGCGPDGKRWARLKPETIIKKMGTHSTTRIKKGELYKSKVGGATRRFASLNKRANSRSMSPTSPLIDTGMLMTPTVHGEAHRGIVRLAGSRSAKVWGGKSISQIHDEGSGNVPQRKHWGFYPLAEKRIREFAEKRIRQMVAELMR